MIKRKLPKYKEIYYKFMIVLINFWDGSYNYEYREKGRPIGGISTGFFILGLGAVYMISYNMILHFFGLNNVENSITVGLIKFGYALHFVFYMIYKFLISKPKPRISHKIKNYFRKKIGFKTFHEE